MAIERVAIIGRGAVGLLYGAIAEKNLGPGAVQYVMDDVRFARHAGETVTVNGEPCRVPTVPASEATPVDLVILAIKAPGLPVALDTMERLVGPRTAIASLINGVTSEERIAERFGWGRTVLSVAQGMDAVFIGTDMTYSHPGEIRFGAAPGTAAGVVENVADLYARAGIPHVVEADIRHRMWTKLMLNVGINQVCIVYGGTYGTASAPESEQNRCYVAAMREAILISLDNLINTLTAQIDLLKQNEQETKDLIAASPEQAKYLLSVERQQKVKESLYLFLLQKREENELSQTFTAYNTRVINPPAGSPLPTEPKKGSILLMALAVGLFLPVVVLFMMEMMDTTVRSRKDLEGLNIPFVGEIPLYEPKKKHLLPQHAETAVVVREKGRDVVNESFRIVRTNLEFMDGGKTAGRTIMITSMNPGSGKTFISLNLALSFAIKGKRVLAIDLDMRRKSLSDAVDKKAKTGISNYLAEQVDALDDIILRHPLHANLDVIPVGTIPPNPTELLFSKRLESMLAELRKEYDLILIDCPPSEIVADVAIVNEFVDVMLFIVRAGLFERSMLPDLDNFYTSRKYKNMSLVLNATKARHAQQYYGKYYGKYYGHKYYYDK